MPAPKNEQLEALFRLVEEKAALKAALRKCLTAFSVLAAEAGDSPAFNEGGVAREACKTAREALESL